MHERSIPQINPPTMPLLDRARCTGCGLCALACPCGAITLVNGIPTFHCQDTCLRSSGCVSISHAFHPCEIACPTQAISCLVEIRLARPVA